MTREERLQRPPTTARQTEDGKTLLVAAVEAHMQACGLGRCKGYMGLRSPHRSMSAVLLGAFCFWPATLDCIGSVRVCMHGHGSREVVVVVALYTTLVHRA